MGGERKLTATSEFSICIDMHRNSRSLTLWESWYFVRKWLKDRQKILVELELTYTTTLLLNVLLQFPVRLDSRTAHKIHPPEDLLEDLLKGYIYF
jgi:hypothetical protein